VIIETVTERQSEILKWILKNLSPLFTKNSFQSIYNKFCVPTWSSSHYRQDKFRKSCSNPGQASVA